MLVCFQAVAVEEGVPANLARSLGTLIPGLSPDKISPSPVPGLYEVVYGPNVVYVTGDGRFMVQGDVVDLKTRTNLTAKKRDEARLGVLETLGEDSMIVYGPADAKHTVTVFTDIDCPYCQKLHREMESYNAQGIRIRYLAFPRAGIPSKAYDKAVAVWCSADRNQALTDAKAGRSVKAVQCENSVREHYVMGRMFSISGTPTLILENGTMVPGYVSAKSLREMIEKGDSG
ncbi:MAG: DsbC family protein [Gammaproteobacteria bacterium]|nr:MAG: DsbC family protein [Gammaproteobacteria bacterium]